MTGEAGFGEHVKHACRRHKRRKGKARRRSFGGPSGAKRSLDRDSVRTHSQKRMVGPGRLELPTSRLSGVRSNHLSYGPIR